MLPEAARNRGSPSWMAISSWSGSELERALSTNASRAGRRKTSNTNRPRTLAGSIWNIPAPASLTSRIRPSRSRVSTPSAMLWRTASCSFRWRTMVWIWSSNWAAMAFIASASAAVSIEPAAGRRYVEVALAEPLGARPHELQRPADPPGEEPA